MTNLRRRLVFVDLETAGREPTRPILQIAAVAVDESLHEVEAFEIKVAFDRNKADPNAIRRHGGQTRIWKRQSL